MFFCKTNQFMNGSLSMHPAKTMQKNIKLSGIITDNGHILIISMMDDATNKASFCSNTDMILAFNSQKRNLYYQPATI